MGQFLITNILVSLSVSLSVFLSLFSSICLDLSHHVYSQREMCTFHPTHSLENPDEYSLYIQPWVVSNVNLILCKGKLRYRSAAAAESLQSCPTLCNPIDGSPLGSSVPGILQARIVEGVAISFSNA